MQRQVKLCKGCVEMLDDYFPYLYPDGNPMKREDLLVETVSNVSDCDNEEHNLDRDPIWV